MPKTVPPGLLDPGRVRCLAIKVVRKDGVTFGLTDTNVPFTFDGVPYKPAAGVSASTIQSDTGTSAGSLTFKTLEGVTGAVGQFITAEDLRGGRYQNAEAWVYELDPEHPSLGAIVHNRYAFARATIRDADKDIELRETLYRLKTQTGRTFLPKCDVGCVFDRRCDPEQALKALYSFSRVVAEWPSDFVVDFGGDDHDDDYYTKGYLEWTSGANAPLLSEIKRHQRLAGNVARLTLATPAGFDVAVGDVATLVRGCGREREDCQAMENPNNPSGTNIENHQGFRLPIPDDAGKVGRQPKS